MPSRKSDARRSDVSVARFVLADEDSTMATDPPATEPAAPAASATAEPSVSGSTPGPQHTSEKKDKDKERERERERERDTLTIEDLTLPKSIITRLAKGVLPPNTQIQANAILALTKSATVFISHLANAANDFTVGSNKKTINPTDVFKALDEIEYGFMRERLEAEFAKFNEVQTSKRSTYRKKVAAAKKAGAGGAGSSSTDPTNQSMTTDAGIAADASMLSMGSTTRDGGVGDDGDETEVDRSLLSERSPAPPGAGAGGSEGRAAKKARLDVGAAGGGGGGGGVRMEVDGEEGEGEVSDAETVPEEEEEQEEEDDEEEEEEEEEDDDEEEEQESEDGDGEGRGDELEERADRVDEDEALDDDSD